MPPNQTPETAAPAPVPAPAAPVAPLPPVPAASGLKKASLFYVAATHWLTAAFVIPLLGGLLFGIVFGIAAATIFGAAFVTSVVGRAIVSIAGLVLVWLGVIYSSKFIGGRYEVADPVAVAKKATVIAVVVGVVFRVLSLPLLLGSSDASVTSFVVALVFFAISVVVFYVASVKYLKKNV